MSGISYSRFGLRDSLMESVFAIADRYGIERLYLFGSRARGDFGERSDIDLAAYGGRVGEFYADLEEETSTLLFFDVVDLKRGVSDELRTELDRDGVLIYEKI